MILHARLWLGRWMLRPHWIPLLEHYNRMQLPDYNPRGITEREHCTYVVIGIKRAIGLAGGWYETVDAYGQLDVRNERRYAE